MRLTMGNEEYEKSLEELYDEADRRGCCVIPATPIKSPDEDAK